MGDRVEGRHYENRKGVEMVFPYDDRLVSQ